MHNKIYTILKYSLFIVTMFFGFSVVLSCRNSFTDYTTRYNQTNQTEQATRQNSVDANGKIVNFTGTVNDLFSLDGAFPTEFTAHLAGFSSGTDSDTGAISGTSATPAYATNSRSAMPTKPETGCTISVTATADEEETLSQPVDGNSFSLLLIAGKVWTVTVAMKSGSIEILRDSAVFDLTTAAVVSHDFVLKPLSEGNGTISLDFSKPDSVFNSVTVVSVKKDGADASSDWTDAVNCSTSGLSMKTGKSLAAGVYDIKLDFKKDTKLVYTTMQTINVFPNMTTDKWVTSLAITDSDGNSQLRVTQQMADAFNQTEFFVGGESADDGNGNTGRTPYKPLATVAQAVTLINTLLATNSANEPVQYTIHVKDGISPEEVAETIIIKRNITVECWKSSPGDKRGAKTLTRNANVSIFTVSSGGSLTIDGVETSDGGWSGLVLDGNKNGEDGTASTDDDITGSGITINMNGTLTLNGGTIQNCKSANGGAVYVSDGSFIMNCGTICGNTATSYGGGVYISCYNNANSGFTMNGGKITGNSAPSGGGVDTSAGSFTMKGGTITANNSTGTGSSSGGGGVRVKTGTFTMENGTISGNTATSYGGGVYMYRSSSTFNMSGGTIGGNNAKYGGGVYNEGGTMYMHGSAVIGDAEQATPASDTTHCSNYATKGGGGIYSSYNGVKLYIGYKPGANAGDDPVADADFSGGIYYNYCSTTSTNPDDGGGGILQYAGDTLITNCKIKNNGSTYNGGGILQYNGTCVITNTEISGNSAKFGGGIYDNKNIELSDGTVISGNTATSNGSGVFVYASTFKISGSAYIKSAGTGANDIYLDASPSNAKITITGALNPPSAANGIVATIKPYNYTSTDPVVVAAEGVSTNVFTAACGKFNITSNTSNGVTTFYKLNTDGSISAEPNSISGNTVSVSSSSLDSLEFTSGTSYDFVVDEEFSNSDLSSLFNNIKSSNIGASTVDLSDVSITSMTAWVYGKVETIILPSGVTSLSSQTFENGSALKEIVVSEDNPNYTTVDGVLYNKDKTKLICYPRLKEGNSFTLPDTVTSLAYGAFFKSEYLEEINGLQHITTLDDMNVFQWMKKIKELNLTGLTSGIKSYAIEYSSVEKVYLSSSVSSFGMDCFYYCSKLSEIHFARTTPPSLNNGNGHTEFTGCNSNLKFYVPSGSKSAYLGATGDRGFANPDYNALASSLSSRIIEE